jgi:hypothetical protein
MPSTRKELRPPNGERPQRRRRRRGLAMLSWRRTTTLWTAPVRFCPPKRSSNSFQKVSHAVFHTIEHNHIAHTPIFAPRSALQSAYAFKTRQTIAAKRMGKIVGAILAAHVKRAYSGRSAKKGKKTRMIWRRGSSLDRQCGAISQDFLQMVMTAPLNILPTSRSQGLQGYLPLVLKLSGKILTLS